MKNLANMLKKGDLRPRERVILLAQNDVAKDTTGKEILSDSEKHSLGEGWRPQNNYEVEEYNKYLEGWRVVGAATLDAQTTFLNAQTEHFRKQPLVFNFIMYPHHREMQMSLQQMMEIKRVTVNEAVAIGQMQKAVKMRDGVDFDYGVYELAFELLSDADKNRLRELYVDIETDHDYLDQEEIIANLLDGKDELSEQGKKKLAALVAEKAYNSFAKEYQLFHYFACIPLAEVARYFLFRKGVSIEGKSLSKDQGCDDEDSDTHDAIQKTMKTYADEHDVTVESMLKEGCRKWLDGDLFEQYPPLALSDDNELLKRWFTSKREAVTLLKKNIANGVLKLRNRLPDESRLHKLYSKGLYDAEREKAQRALETMELQATSLAKDELDEKPAFATFSDVVISGESLYEFKSDWAFVKEFRERVGRYDPNLGLVYADDDPKQEGEHLDQELLIVDTDKNGELSFFSVFGLAAMRLKAFLDGGMFLEEVEKDGERVLAFSNKRIEQAFIEAKDDLVEGYASLLAFNQMFERLSKIYEIGLTYKTAMWLATLGKYIDDHNEALRIASGELPEKDAKLFTRLRPVVKVDPAFWIDRAKIKPKSVISKRYLEEFEKLFGVGFGT